MFEKYNEAILDYNKKWQDFVAERQNQDFFANLKVTAACWKADDLADHNRRVQEFGGSAEHIHSAWMNERWLTTIFLRESLSLELGIKIVKIYQKRPGSSDASGLDHLDFYAPQIDEDVLADEPGLEWTHESNNQFCKWISLWFSGTEAKLRTNTTLDVCAAELIHASKEVTGE